MSYASNFTRMLLEYEIVSDMIYMAVCCILLHVFLYYKIKIICKQRNKNLRRDKVTTPVSAESKIAYYILKRIRQ